MTVEIGNALIPIESVRTAKPHLLNSPKTQRIKNIEKHQWENTCQFWLVDLSVAKNKITLEEKHYFYFNWKTLDIWARAH